MPYRPSDNIQDFSVGMEMNSAWSSLTALESLDMGALLFVLLISKLQLYFVEG